MDRSPRSNLPWRDPSYLRAGTERQQAAYRALQELGLFRDLAPYDPVLIGTLPLGVDHPDSDLDIACYAPDLMAFLGRATALYGQRPDFRLARKTIRDVESVVVNFRHAGFPVEIFAQPQPVEQQYGYRHLLVEARLLALGGEEARKAIQALKIAGFGTEPAFARYFRLRGDPYERLWQLSFVDDATLAQAVGEAEALHPPSSACPFCRIVAGEETASRVLETATVLAFMNQRQLNPGHVLVVPKPHIATVDQLPDPLARDLSVAVVRVARAIQVAFQPPGLSVWQSNGPTAGQEIPHLHVHLLPRFPDDHALHFYASGPPSVQPRASLEALAQRLRQHLTS